MGKVRREGPLLAGAPRIFNLTVDVDCSEIGTEFEMRIFQSHSSAAPITNGEPVVTAMLGERMQLVASMPHDSLCLFEHFTRWLLAGICNFAGCCAKKIKSPPACTAVAGSSQ